MGEEGEKAQEGISHGQPHSWEFAVGGLRHEEGPDITPATTPPPCKLQEAAAALGDLIAWKGRL